MQERVTELEEALDMKSGTIDDLTEYMNQQAEKISELTKDSITTINNYELKIEEKDQAILEMEKKI